MDWILCIMILYDSLICGLLPTKKQINEKKEKGKGEKDTQIN